MLNVQRQILESITRIYRLADTIAQRDRDLARQLRRASSSIALNTSEGLYASMGHRRQRLETAIQSARETEMALRLAFATRSLSSRREVDHEAEQLDQIRAQLYCLARR